jgi:hypothetical protein
VKNLTFVLIVVFLWLKSLLKMLEIHEMLWNVSMYQRTISKIISEALALNPVVFLAGARQDTGDKVLPFGSRMWAMPISALRSTLLFKNS